jgi:hypothetical protein
VTGSSDMRRADYETALGLITSERVDTASMVTHRFPLEKVDDAFQTAGSQDAVKVAVLPAWIRPPARQRALTTVPRPGPAQYKDRRHPQQGVVSGRLQWTGARSHY